MSPQISVRPDPAAWDRAVAGCPSATVFHRFGWCKLMEELPDVTFHPVWVEAEGVEHPLPVFSQDGRWSWSLLGYGGPCPADGTRLSFTGIESAMRRVQGSPTTRVSLPFRSDVFEDVSGSPVWGRRITHILDLPTSYDRYWRASSGKVRTGVRYAEKRGVEVAPLEVEHLPRLHAMYGDLMLDHGARHILSARFFEAAFGAFGSDEMLGLGAFVDRRLVAGGVFLFDRLTAYHWLHVTGPEGRSLQAGYALIDAALRHAISRGCRWLDLGSSHRASIARHKETWGGRPVTHLLYEAAVES